MASSLNKVFLLGNMTRDVELRYTAGGTAVTEVGMAVNEKRKQGDEWVDDVTYVDVTLWGKTAEIAGKYLSKGFQILIEGRLKLDSWEKDGQKHYKMKVVGEKLQMLGSRGAGGAGGAAKSDSGSSQYSDNSQDLDDSEIPF